MSHKSTKKGKGSSATQASQNTSPGSRRERQIELSNGGLITEYQDRVMVLTKWPISTKPRPGEYIRLGDGRVLRVLSDGKLRVTTAGEQEKMRTTDIVHDEHGPREARSRWAAAIDLMRRGGAVEEFEANEPSYQTDHVSALLALARQVG